MDNKETEMDAMALAMFYILSMPADQLETELERAFPGGNKKDQYATLLDQLTWCKFYPQLSE